MTETDSPQPPPYSAESCLPALGRAPATLPSRLEHGGQFLPSPPTFLPLSCPFRLPQKLQTAWQLEFQGVAESITGVKDGAWGMC